MVCIHTESQEQGGFYPFVYERLLETSVGTDGERQSAIEGQPTTDSLQEWQSG